MMGLTIMAEVVHGVVLRHGKSPLEGAGRTPGFWIHTFGDLNDADWDEFIQTYEFVGLPPDGKYFPALYHAPRDNLEWYARMERRSRETFRYLRSHYHFSSPLRIRYEYWTRIQTWEDACETYAAMMMTTRAGGEDVRTASSGFALRDGDRAIGTRVMAFLLKWRAYY